MPRRPIGRTDIVLVTGGGSGIGAGLARAMHERGSTVIVAGRNRDALDAVTVGQPRMTSMVMDVADSASVAQAVEDVLSRHGELTMLVNNAGVQRLHDFAAPSTPHIADLRQEIDINLMGLIGVTTAFLPVLRRSESSRLVHVSSALALVPLAAAPVYSATKAAVRSFTISLRHQLAGSPVQVVELLPPVVKTGLHRDQPRQPPRAMDLDAFVAAAMKGLDSGADEVPVGLARILLVGSRVAPRRFFSIVNRGG